MFTPHHVSHVRCQVSGLRCQVSDVRHHLFYLFFSNIFLEKVVRLVGGGSVINAAYPVQFSSLRTFLPPGKIVPVCPVVQCILQYSAFCITVCTILQCTLYSNAVHTAVHTVLQCIHLGSTDCTCFSCQLSGLPVLPTLYKLTPMLKRTNSQNCELSVLEKLQLFFKAFKKKS